MVENYLNVTVQDFLKPDDVFHPDEGITVHAYEAVGEFLFQCLQRVFDQKIRLGRHRVDVALVGLEIDHIGQGYESQAAGPPWR